MAAKDYIQLRHKYCPNCEKETSQEQPDPKKDEWRCYRCGMFLNTERA